jgi:tetratricopeptide (TPR) repeat protein
LTKNRRKKPGSRSRAAFWVIVTLLIAAFSVVWWFWPGLYNASPEFYYLLFEKNGQPLKLLNGEALRLHPQDRVKLIKVSTNITLNLGVRLVASDIDVNALSYETLPVATLLSGRSVLRQHRFRIQVKQHNEDMGYVDMVVEPYVEDWLEKADRTIDSDLKIKVLEEARQFAPEDTQIRDRLLEAYKSKKRWSKAAALLEDMAKEKADENTLADLLDVYEAMGHTEGAIDVLRRLADLKPKDVNIKLRLAIALEDAKKPKEAIAFYEASLKDTEKNKRLPIYKTLGYLYTEIGQIDKAIAAFLNAVELDSKDANLYYNLSTLYERAGNKERADFFLAKAISLQPEDMESRLKLAESLVKAGKFQEAESHLKDILKKKPDSARAMVLLADILEKQGDKQGLIDIYKKMLSLDPKNETLVYNVAVLEYETGRIKESIPHFESYLESHPDDAEVHSILFDIFKTLNKEDLVLREAQALIRLKPKEIGPYYAIFEILTKQGDYQKVIKEMQRGLKSHPESTDLRGFLILAYLKTGKEDLAIEEMRNFLKAKPKDKKMRLQLAQLLEKQGNIQEASDMYEKILDIAPRDKEAKEAYLRLLSQLAELQEERGNFGEALETVKKILEISPGNAEAEEAYLRLRLKVLPREG